MVKGYWKQNYRTAIPNCFMDQEKFYDWIEDRVELILRYNKVIIAANEEADDHVFGWLCCSRPLYVSSIPHAKAVPRVGAMLLWPSSWCDE